MPSPIEFLLVKVQAFKNVLNTKSARDKDTNVPIQTAEQFNAILADIKAQSPESAPHLPAPIEWDSSNMLTRHIEVTMIKFTDLEIKIETVLGILDLLKAGH